MHHPRKRFGQNFLIDENVVDRIVAAIAPGAGEKVVEVGPGLGVLTRRLVAAGVDLEVIEIDRDLAAALPARVPGLTPAQIHVGDALKVDFPALFSCNGDNDCAMRVVGNLPYNISTPLLVHLFGSSRATSPTISDMHFMLQKEIVTRMAASPGGRTFGRLTLLCQLHCRVIPLFDVPSLAFDPSPKVDSTFVRLIVHQEPPVDLPDRVVFDRVVSAAFAQRRKTLRNSLKSLVSADVIRGAGIDPGLRAESLGLEEYAALAAVVAKLDTESSAGT